MKVNLDQVGVIILAAGRGTRMGGDEPKALKLLAGRPLIFWTLDTLKEVGLEKIIIVTGYQSEKVEKAIIENNYRVIFAHQGEILGTAKAAQFGVEHLSREIKKVLILFGDDSALFTPQTITELLKSFNNPGTLLVTRTKGPTTLGGLKRDDRGNLIEVMFKSQLIAENIKQPEILCGAMVFNRNWLWENLQNIQPSNLSGEYPLPALIQIAASQRNYLKTFLLVNPDEWTSINTKEELQLAEVLKSKLAHVRK